MSTPIIDTERYFRASEIFSTPERRGLLPICRTTFYFWVRDGVWPPPDITLTKRTKLWSETRVTATLEKIKLQ